MLFEPWMLAAMDDAGYNGIRDEHIGAVAEELLRTGKTDIAREDFEAVCEHCGIAPNNFTQADLNTLEGALNRG